MDYFLDNGTCRAQPIDRDTVLISFYGMTRKALNDISVMNFIYDYWNFMKFSQTASLYKQSQRHNNLQAGYHQFQDGLL